MIYNWIQSIDYKKIVKTVVTRIKNHDIKNNKIELSTFILSVIIFLYTLNILEMLIITMLTLGYPMINTYHLIKTNDVDKYFDILTYWTFYASFAISETLLWFILKFIPMYDTLKILFMLWAILPQTNGYKIIYTNYIAPLLEKYNYEKFDKVFTIVTTKVSEGIEEMQKIDDNKES